jgi:hypothetical protein
MFKIIFIYMFFSRLDFYFDSAQIIKSSALLELLEMGAAPTQHA